MAMSKIGTVKNIAILNFFKRSLYVLFSSSPVGSIGTRSIPHIGQDPGASLIISGCIGQVYCFFFKTLCTFSKFIPHTGTIAGLIISLVAFAMHGAIVVAVVIVKRGFFYSMFMIWRFTLCRRFFYQMHSTNGTITGLIIRLIAFAMHGAIVFSSAFF